MGSVMFSRLLPLLFLHKDITKMKGDGTPGAFNVFTNCGAAMGLLCLFLDAAKGFVPVLLANLLDNHSWFFAAVIAAPTLGHAVGLFNGMKGGKCIATIFGSMLALVPTTFVFALLATLYILFSTAIKIRSHTKRSVVTFILFGIASTMLLCYRGFPNIAAGCLTVSLLAILKHLTIPHKNDTTKKTDFETNDSANN